MLPGFWMTIVITTVSRNRTSNNKINDNKRKIKNNDLQEKNNNKKQKLGNFFIEIHTEFKVLE